MLKIVFATLPVIVAGFLLKDRLESDWRSPAHIMVTTVLFGITLWLADRRADCAAMTLADMSWRRPWRSCLASAGRALR